MQVHSAAAEQVPEAPASGAVRRVVPPTPKNVPDGRALIVDDDALMRWSLAETLTDCGYAVLEAEDGRAAVEALKDTPQPIDVIMLDYRLPDSNDMELLTRIRVISPLSRVVLMTAYGTPDVFAEAVRLGAVCAVDKPIEIDDVAGLVSRVRESHPT